MRKVLFLFTAVVVFSAFAYGQKETTSFAGTWKLDVDSSELGERSRLESMTMTVTQTETELSYDRKAERKEREGMGGGGRGMGRGGGMGGDQSQTFDLTGKETIAPGTRGGSSKLKAAMDGAILKLVLNREFNGPMGSMSIKTVEKWSLSEDGKTLTIKSETATPRGDRNTTMVFTKSE